MVSLVSVVSVVSVVSLVSLVSVFCVLVASSRDFPHNPLYHFSVGGYIL